MLRHFLLLTTLMSAAGICRAQSGELQVFYLRAQGFDFRSGSAAFDIRGARLNGGGFGLSYNVTEWMALWSQAGFFSGVRQGDIRMNMISQLQGVALSRGRGAFRAFVKGGTGFARYVFEQPGLTSVSYGQAFSYGGGIQIGFTPSFFFVLEAAQLAVGLPNLTGVPGRDKWDSTPLITTGLAIHF